MLDALFGLFEAFLQVVKYKVNPKIGTMGYL